MTKFSGNFFRKKCGYTRKELDNLEFRAVRPYIARIYNKLRVSEGRHEAVWLTAVDERIPA